MDNMQNMGGSQGTKNVCKCAHHKVIPVLVLLFGLTFLLGSWGILTSNAVDTIWPIIVILAGAMKISEKSGMCKCC